MMINTALFPFWERGEDKVSSHASESVSWPLRWYTLWMLFAHKVFKAVIPRGFTGYPEDSHQEWRAINDNVLETRPENFSVPNLYNLLNFSFINVASEGVGEWEAGEGGFPIKTQAAHDPSGLLGVSLFRLLRGTNTLWNTRVLVENNVAPNVHCL